MQTQRLEIALCAQHNNGGLSINLWWQTNVPDHNELDSQTQEVAWNAEGCTAQWRDVHPLPEGAGFFENVWRGYRENGNVY